jgi:hypothetical protein
MSLKVQIESLFLWTPKAKEQGRKHEEEKEDTCDFCLKFFEEKTLTLFIFKPHIFSIFSPF